MTVTFGDHDYALVMFDLDDTLAPSKSPLDDAMVEVLRRLLQRSLVCIISGGATSSSAPRSSTGSVASRKSPTCT